MRIYSRKYQYFRFALMICVLLGSIYAAQGQRSVPQPINPSSGGLSMSAPKVWVPVTPNKPAKSLIFDWQGGMYVIGLDDEMYASKSGSWRRLKPGLKVKSMTVKPDGTIMAVDLSGDLIHSLRGKTWTKTSDKMDQLVSTINGQIYGLKDGNLVGEDKAPVPSTQSFKYIAAATKTNSVYLLSKYGKVFRYDVGSKLLEVPGGTPAICVAGTGEHLRGANFISGPLGDGHTYFNEIEPSNFWAPVPYAYAAFIALSPTIEPASKALFALGNDRKIYRYIGNPYERGLMQ